ncbi:hypothetical protein, partial [Propionicimonas sp.]|uniref:hypothetical protein n=1 Tax=Propionicimonas sp. TaxID=1955623 RepID=UPI0039E5B962
VGSSVSPVAGRLRPPGRRALGLVAGLLLGAGTLAQLASTDGFSFPRAGLAAVIGARSGCVTTDHPVALILTDRLRTDLRAGCRLVVDLSGYIHVLPGSDQRRDNPDFQAVMMDYLDSGDTTIVMSGLWPGDFSRTNRAIVQGWPVVGSAGGIDVRQPVR